MVWKVVGGRVALTVMGGMPGKLMGVVTGIPGMVGTGPERETMCELLSVQ